MHIQHFNEMSMTSRLASVAVWQSVQNPAQMPVVTAVLPGLTEVLAYNSPSRLGLDWLPRLDLTQCVLRMRPFCSKCAFCRFQFKVGTTQTIKNLSQISQVVLKGLTHHNYVVQVH